MQLKYQLSNDITAYHDSVFFSSTEIDRSLLMPENKKMFVDERSNERIIILH